VGPTVASAKRRRGHQRRGKGGVAQQPPGPLGTFGKPSTPPRDQDISRRQLGRGVRGRLKDRQRRITASVSSRLCWFVGRRDGSSEAVVDVGADFVARVSGIMRCGSSWACPTCAPVVRERRAAEIDQGLGEHLASGGGALFVTFTCRHHGRDRLEPRLALMSRAFGAVLDGMPWQRRRVALGYVGLIRATEITWGEANGWHPHSHGLMLFERPLTAEERRDLEAWLRVRWAGVLERCGFGTINSHGVDVQAVTTAGDLAGYLAKVEGGWGAGLELARADLKTKGGGERRTPMQVLEEFADTGDLAMRGLWLEYEAATFGKRAIVWSPGLKARLGVVEVTDEEAAAMEGEDVTLWRFTFSSREWNAVVVTGAVADLLTACEDECRAAWARGDRPEPFP
jgi:hypothetical protein